MDTPTTRAVCLVDTTGVVGFQVLVRWYPFTPGIMFAVDDIEYVLELVGELQQYEDCVGCVASATGGRSHCQAVLMSI